MPTAVQRGFVSEELYNQFLKDADLLKAEGLIADEDYTKIVSGSFQEAQDALSRSFGASDKAKSKLLKVGDLDEFQDVVETPSGLVFGFPKLTTPKPPEISIPEPKILEAVDKALPKPITTAGFVRPEPPTQVPLPPPPRPTLPGEVAGTAGKKAIKIVKDTKGQAGKVPEVKTQIEEAVVAPPRTADLKKTFTFDFLGPFRKQEIFTDKEIEAINKQGGFGKIVADAVSEPTPEGKIVESTPMWIARLLGTIPETAIGVVEGVITDKTIPEAVSERIKKGRGFAGAGYDIAEAISDNLGLPKEGEEGFKEYPLRAVLGEGAWLVGLLTDIVLPLDLFAGEAIKVATLASQAEKAEKAGVAVAKQIKPGFGNIVQKGITRFAKNNDNLDIAFRVITDTADDVIEAGRAKIGFPKKTDTAYQKTLDASVASILTDNKINRKVKLAVIETFDKLKSADEPSRLNNLLDNVKKDVGVLKTDADAINEAENLVAEKMLEFVGKNQLVKAGGLLANTAKPIRIGNYLIPVGDAKTISAETKQLFKDADVRKQIADQLKAGVDSPVIKLDEDLVNTLKQSDLSGTEEILKKAEITPEEYNTLISSYLADAVSKSPTAVLAEGLSAGEKAGKTGKEAVKERSIIGKGLEAIAKSIKEEGLITTFRNEFERLVGGERRFTGEELLSPEAREQLKIDKARIASIPNKFEADINRGIKAGKSRAEANADAIVSSYKNPKELFEDFLATIFGAEERVVETRQTLTGDEVLTRGRINPKKGMEALIALGEDAESVIGKAKEEFAKLIDAGKNKEAIEFLGKVHKFLEGKELSKLDPQVFTRNADKVAVLETAKPVITADKFLPSLFFTFANRKARDIVLDVAQRGLPKTIPVETSRLLERFQSALKETKVGERIGNLFREDKTFRDLVADDIRRLANTEIDDFEPQINKYLVDKYDLSKTPPDYTKFSAGKGVPGISKADIDAFLKTDEFLEAVKNIRLLDKESVAGTLARIVADKFDTSGVAKQLKAQARTEKSRKIIQEAQAGTLTPKRLAEIKKEYGDAVGTYVGLRQQLKQDFMNTADAFVQQNKTNAKENPSIVLRDKVRQAYEQLFKNIPTEALPAEYLLGMKPVDVAYEFGKKTPTQVYLDTLALAVEGAGTRITKPLKDLMRSTTTNAYILSQLEKGRQLAVAGKTLDNMKTIPKTDIDPSVIKGIGEDYSLEDVLKEIKDTDLTPRAKGILARVFQPGIVDTTLTGVSNVVKQGLLAGAWVPNLVNHMTNAITAPAIILSTLGGKKALKATKNFFDPFVGQSLGELFVAGPKQTGKALLETPSGKVYTPRQIADLVAENGIAQTREALALSQGILEDFVRWSGKTLSGEDIGIARQFARSYSPTKPNVWFELANWVDTRFRTAVLVDALREGKSEAQALEEARKALFDYSKVSQFERDYITKYAWFWAFERSAISQVAKNLLTNPGRYYKEQKLKSLMNDDGNAHSAEDFYNQNRVYLGLIEDPVIKRRYNIYGPSLPQGEAVGKIADYLALLPPLLYGDIKQAGETAFGTAISRVGANPAVSIPLSIANKDIVFGDLTEPTDYLDPRIFAILSRNPYAWEAFSSMIELQEIPGKDRTPEMTTIDGKAYRIRRDDAKSKYAYNVMLELAKTIGVERALRDYAPLFTGQKEGEYTPLSLDVENDAIETLRDLGLLKLSPEKTAIEQQSKLRKQQIREIGEE